MSSLCHEGSRIVRLLVPTVTVLRLGANSVTVKPMTGTESTPLESTEAKPYSIHTLLGKLARGEIRVPKFQRQIKWEPEDAKKLFDSIFRGYPIGTLLFWLRDAPAEQLSYGTVEIVAKETPDALWVVDGQQRVHALARVLLGRGAPEEPFALYFDLPNEKFEFPLRRGGPPENWLPMTEVLDEERLQEWIFPRRDVLPVELRQRAYRLGRILRQFEIPSYAVRTTHESAVREIFSRVNSTGKRMEDFEVFDALHGALDTVKPSRMSEIAMLLGDLGFGAPDEGLLFKMLAAVLSEDISKPIPPLKPEEATVAYQTLEKIARAAALFLREDAHIPHISLLPYETPLIGLARFFSKHHEPSARSRELLSRWVWRGALTGLHSGDTISKRNMLRAIGENENHSVRDLLRDIPRNPVPVHLSDFRAGTADGNLLVLALLDLGPLHLETGTALPVQPELLQTLYSRPPPPYIGNLANRIVHPRLSRLVSVLANTGEASILASHGISREAQEHLRRGDRAGFIRLREQTLRAAAESLFARRARWEEPDDLPIHALVVEEGD